MIDSEKAEKLLKALADKSRLQILECIQEGTSNPGEIAKDLNRQQVNHRKTSESTSGGEDC